MPHLAPLSWALAPLFFWALLLSIITLLWWTPNPEFPVYSASSKFSFSQWKWN